MFHEIKPNQYYLDFRTTRLEPEDTILYYEKGCVLCRWEDDLLVLPTAVQIGVTQGQYLFTVDKTGYYMPLEEITSKEGWEFRRVSVMRDDLPHHKAFAAVTGHHMTQFYQNNRFCGRCGHPMRHSAEERAMVCPECGRVAYPQICPSVIVGVVHEDTILLTKYQPSHSAYQHYALIAGYSEIGESLEETVIREVKEEVGLDVTDLRYYKSQPWPFSGAILAGFFCRVKGDTTVKLEAHELREGSWIARRELEPRPESPSLTGEMIEQFRLGLDPYSLER